MIENPNPNAKIGFVILYPFFFHVFKDVYKYLKRDAEFIIDLGIFFPNQQPENLVRDIIHVLQKHGVSYRILRYEDYYHPRFLRSFFAQYSVLVGVWKLGAMNLECTRGKKTVLMQYGAGKEITTYSLSKISTNLFLAYGEPGRGFYSLFTDSVVVGNPRFDDWFKDTVDVSAIKEIKSRLDPEKKTILYLPTHSDLSSIDVLAKEVGRLKEAYNVLVKLHHYTPREEPERTARMEAQGVIVVHDDTDPLPLLKVADAVISDNSSAIFDAILADKPLVLADFWDKDELDVEHRKIKKLRRGFRGALTYSESIEQRIKKDGSEHTLRRAADLRKTIANALLDSAQYKKKRKVLRDQLFAFTDGRSAERAAEAINALLRATDVKPRPFLYHALVHYTEFTLQRPNRPATWIEEHLSAQEDFKKRVLREEGGIAFSIIMLPRAAEHRPQALRSIHEQDFPKKKYELIELSEGETLGARVHSAAKESKGKIICFATDDCVLPSDWLSTLYLAYERHPGALGAGGYEWATSEISTPYDEYRYREIARKLNVPLASGFLEKFYEVCNSIPTQNPMGDLSATSYRRDALTTLSLRSIRTSAELERFLKVQTSSLGPLCFIPAPVSRLSQTTQRGFLEEMMEHGRLDRAFGIRMVHGFWSSYSEE